MEARRKARGTTAQNDAYTGPSGQITVDMDRKEVRIHDGVTPGGIRVLNKTQNDLLYQAIGSILISDVTGLQTALDDIDAAAAAKLPLTGGTLTGNLVIVKVGPQILLQPSANDSNPVFTLRDYLGNNRAGWYWDRASGNSFFQNTQLDGVTLNARIVLQANGAVNISPGVLQVAGNLVPAPASQAHGDMLYRAGSAWARLAPGTAGQALLSGGAGAAPTWGNAGGGVTMAAQDVADGNVDFTGIPSGAKMIQIVYSNVQRASGSRFLDVQLGDSGGYETADYDTTLFEYNIGTSTWTGSDPTAGFRVPLGLSSGSNHSSGMLTLVKQEGNAWVMSGQTGDQPAVAGRVIFVNGVKTLSAALDRIRLAFSGGAFSSGRCSITYFS